MKYELDLSNPPNGATHYFEETEDSKFAWFDEINNLILRPVNSVCWEMVSAYDDISNAVQIPQQEAKMNIDKLATQVQEVEWNGDGLPPVGVMCNFTPHNKWGFNCIEDFTGTVLHYEGEQFVFMLNHDRYKLKEEMVIVSRTDKGDFSKPESPEEKEKRERLEAAYDLYLLRCNADNDLITYEFHEFKSEPEAVNGWLAIVDKTGYRVTNHD